MKNINPIHIFSIFLLLFIGIGIWLIYFLINLKISYFGIIALGLVVIALSFLLYSINFGISVSKKTTEKVNDTKKRLAYTESKVIIDVPILEKKIELFWNTIEAIFLLNKPPLDGEYHNFEYTIVLNSEPTTVPYDVQSWYNKISILPKPKKKGLPIIKINDDSNSDFHTFNEAVHKYLRNVNEDSTEYLKLKFGNEVENIKTKTETKMVLDKPIKTIGFYAIFDRGNDLNDERLHTFRQETANKNQ
jgi:hypothetical protein